jgi:O-antigen/teichoic acid export membrane protein
MLGHLITLLSGLLFAGMSIKYLGAANAGFFILVTSVFGWVQIAGGGAFQAPAVRKIALLVENNQNDRIYNIVKTVCTVNIVVSLPFVFFSIYAFPTLFSWSKLELIQKDKAFVVLLFACFGFLLDQYSSSLRTIYEGFQRFDILAFLKTFFGIIGNLLRLVTLFMYKDMIALATINVIISFVTIIVDIFVVNTLIGEIILPGWEKGIISSLFSFGFWGWLGNTGNIILFNLTTIVLTKELGTGALMYISLPQSMIIQVGQFIIGSAYFIFPTLANQGNHIYDVISRIEDRVRWFIALLSIGAFTFLLLFSSNLLTILVNKDYSLHASHSLTIFCLYGMIWAQEIFYVFANMAIGNVKANSITLLLTSLMTLLLTIIFIPKFGYIGLPLAQLIKLIGVVFLTIWSRKLLGLSNSLKSIFSPYITIILSSLIWVIYEFLVGKFIDQFLIIEYFNIILGSFIFITSVFFLENKFFRDKKRILFLLSSFAVLVKKFSPKLSDRLVNYY